MPDDRQESFWTTLPGILTGIAALITALVGVFALIVTAPDTTESSAPPQQTATAPPVIETDAPSSGSDVSSNDADVTANGGDTAGTAGKVTMRLGDQLDVDTSVVGNDVDGADVRYSSQGINLYLQGTEHAIVDSWTDQAGCTAALQARSDGLLPEDQFGDTAICMLTDQEVLAQIGPSAPDDEGTLTVDVIAWP